MDYPACFPDSLVALSARDSEVSIDYLNIYPRLIRRYVENLATQAAQKNINLKQLGSLPVIVPGREIQQTIVCKMNDAYDKKISMLKKAQRIQNSIEEYLLGELGIELIREDGRSLESRIFSTKLKSIVGSRFDPYYHRPFFSGNINNILCGKYQTVPLETVAGGTVKGMVLDESSNDENSNDENGKVIQINSINPDGTVDVTRYASDRTLSIVDKKMHHRSDERTSCTERYRTAPGSVYSR